MAIEAYLKYSAPLASAPVADVGRVVEDWSFGDLGLWLPVSFVPLGDLSFELLSLASFCLTSLFAEVIPL